MPTNRFRNNIMLGTGKPKTQLHHLNHVKLKVRMGSCLNQDQVGKNILLLGKLTFFANILHEMA